MERILQQDEIDALFRAARGQQAGPPRRQRQVARCDFRQAGQITREQARSVGGLHDRFARNLGHSLGAYLRTRVELTLVAIEQLGFGEFMQRMPEVSYIASLAVSPIGARAAVQLDLSLAYPMIELVLGGKGSAMPHAAEVTEIEEQMLESIVVVAARELQQVWQPVLDLSFNYEERQLNTQIFRLMPPTEKVMAITFEVEMPGARGMLNLIFPAVVSTGLLRKLSEAWVYHKRNEAPDTRPRLRQHLAKARFDLELALPPAPVPIRDLMDLRVGQVLTFPHPANVPARVNICGRPVFEAQAIRRHRHRAALIRVARGAARMEGGN